jgi:C-8 sterol isomerase
VDYVFDQHVLHGVAKEAVASGKPLRGKVAILRERLHEIYPGHVNLQDDWVFNVAGGAMGQMTVLHASLTEYVIVFGTPIGTEGFSGRFLADDYFMILEGEQWAFAEGDGEKMVFKPGDMHHMPRGEARGYRMPEHCFALEYARGNIPAMLPFGLVDQFTSILDARTVAKTLKIYTQAAVGAMLNGRRNGNGQSSVIKAANAVRGWLGAAVKD